MRDDINNDNYVRVSHFVPLSRFLCRCPDFCVGERQKIGAKWDTRTKWDTCPKWDIVCLQVISGGGHLFVNYNKRKMMHWYLL